MIPDRVNTLKHNRRFLNINFLREKKKEEEVILTIFMIRNKNIFQALQRRIFQ